MSKRNDRTIADRRDFLKLAGLGTVVGGAALVTGQSAAKATEELVENEAGYRETDHVKKTYDLARF